jgi:CxxC-x17-CxxC domain-containing protein
MKKFENIFDREKRNTAKESDFKSKNFGKKRFNDNGKRRPQMHEAICSDCGRKCEIPFKPTTDRPIYCSDCFKNHGAESFSNKSERREYKKPRFEERRMFSANCDKCGKRFELPFKPTGDKPVYCNDCFERPGASSKTSDHLSNQYKEQLDLVNAKLDKILNLLSLAGSAKEKKEGTVKQKEVVVEKEEKSQKTPAKKKKEETKKTKKVIVKKVVAKKSKKKK